MKKTVTFLLTFALVLSFLPNAFAATATANANDVSEDSEIVTLQQANENSNLSAYDRGKEVMLSLGIPENLITDMSPTHVEQYSDGTNAVLTSQYLRVSYIVPPTLGQMQTTSDTTPLYAFISENEMNNLTPIIETIDKETFITESRLVKALQEEIKSTNGNSISLMGLEEKELVFNGYLELKSMAVKKADGTYVLSGRSEWITDPQGFSLFNRRDVFTIAPDTAGYFNNATAYAIRKVTYTKGSMNSSGTWTYSYGNKNKEFTEWNKMDYTDAGFGIEVPIYRSTSSTSSLMDYYSYMGYVSCVMIPRESTPCNMKICVDYAQNSVGFSGSISVGIPKSISISVSPAGKYENPKEAALMFTHPGFVKIS